MQISNEYLNALTCKFYTFSRQNLQTFDISRAFLPLTIAKLSSIKNGPVFWPMHPVYMITFRDQGYCSFRLKLHQCINLLVLGANGDYHCVHVLTAAAAAACELGAESAAELG